MSGASTPAVIGPWLRTRSGPVGGLALLVTLATAPATLSTAALTLALAAALILALRVRDDVASAPRDRVTHPERVACRPEAAAPLNRAAGALMLGVGVALIASGQIGGRGRLDAALALLGLIAALELLYARRPAAAGPLDLLVVLKYPALALLLATAPQWALAGVLGAGLLRFELADDPILGAACPPGLRLALLAAEAALLFALLPPLVAGALAVVAVAVDRLPRRPARAITVITGLELLAPAFA